MPYKATKLKNGKVRVSSPNGVKAKATTPTNAKRQLNLLRGLEFGDWKPTGKKAKK